MSLRDIVLDYFKKLSGVDETNNFDLYLPNVGRAFVKYGDDDILVEAETQAFFYRLAQGDSSAPRIPQVYGAFHGTRGRYFLVMEYVVAPTLEEWAPTEALKRKIEVLNLAASVAAPAVHWLLHQKVPPSTFGRIPQSKACARHRFFKDNWAPLDFADAKALTIYVNKALSRCVPPKPPPIDFTSAPNVIYHSDVKMDNFLVDDDHRIWLIDFQHIGVLPLPFCQYAFYSVGNAFAAAVGNLLNIELHDDVHMMGRAAAIIGQSGNDSFGLDRDGLPARPKVRHRGAWGNGKASVNRTGE
ncbi:hypothetical protein BDZ97DRAFT_1433973 [Flammula alnicola]|nr:hypothetical protein BDZ97DRAFT_1433973 [Flammula alnicola]